MVILKVTRIYTGRQKKSTAPELAPTALLQVSPRRTRENLSQRDETRLRERGSDTALRLFARWACTVKP